MQFVKNAEKQKKLVAVDLLRIYKYTKLFHKDGFYLRAKNPKTQLIIYLKIKEYNTRKLTT